MKSKLLLFLFLAASFNVFPQIGFVENMVSGEAYMTLRPYKVLAADLDGDGDNDIIGHGAQLHWYENVDGFGNFGQRNTIDTQLASEKGSLGIADFDSDGDIDIMATSQNKVMLYKNDSNGNFTVNQLFTLGATYAPLSILPRDMNGDGHMDLVCYYNNGGGAFQGAIAWFQNTGNGTFGAQQIINNAQVDLIYGTIIAVDDLDNDNDLDIVLGYGDHNRLAWFENMGNNVFASPVNISTAAGGISYLSTADLDNDGDKDIVTAQRTHNQLTWYKNMDGSGTFSDELIINASATGINTALVANIDPEVSPDVFYTTGNTIGWHDNSGGDFGPAQVINVKAHGVRALFMADLDGDGMSDLISASYDDDKIAWYQNLDNAGSYGRQVSITRYMESPNNVYAGDFDGDGDIDLLANSQHDAKLTWLENVNGIGFYGKDHIITEKVTVGNITPVAFPADFDGDGDLDIASRQGNNLFWYENDGQGNFPVENLIHNANLATIIRAGDFDGDGDIDIITGQYNNDKLNWYENLGGGNFGPEQIIYNPGGNNGSLTSLRVADMDGDGDLDFIVSSYNSYTNLYKNVDGQGTFNDQNILSFDWMMAVYPADIDGDGDMDVVGAASNGGGIFEAVVWYENNGNGGFLDDQPISTISMHGQDIWAADMDGDGDMDVVTAAGHSNTYSQVAWYPNNGNGTFGDRQMIQEIPQGPVARCVTVTDVNLDGKADVVAVINFGSSWGRISVFENLGVLGNTITGTVTIDTDANGCTSADIKGSGLMVVSQNGTNSFATFTDAQGHFETHMTAGNFTTAISSQLPDYFTSTPASYNFNFTGMSNSGTANFCVAPTGVVNDLLVSVYPLSEVRPGFPAHYRVVYRNNGTTVQSGTVTYTFDQTKLGLSGASQPLMGVSPGTIAFAYENLQLFETRTIDVHFQAFAPPAVNIGNEITTTVTIDPVSGDQVSADNTFELVQTVIGSYDPNDIRCLEGAQVPIADADEYLHYIIRFQNTGTASAINVRVENPLDAKLDWTTMQLESLSHPGRTEIIDGNMLRFSFENIHLAASSVNEPESHGFIAFKIKPLNVSVNDIVQSTADIFFDFNPAITTNTAATLFVGQLSNADHHFGRFVLYPNPTGGTLHVSAANHFREIKVMDLNGRVLKSLDYESVSEARIDVHDLSKGVYLIGIDGERKKFVKQ